MYQTFIFESCHTLKNGGVKMEDTIQQTKTHENNKEDYPHLSAEEKKILPKNKTPI